MLRRGVGLAVLLLVAGFAVSQNSMMPDIHELEESSCWTCHKPGAWEPAWTDALEVVAADIVDGTPHDQLEVTLQNPWTHEIPTLITSIAPYPYPGGSYPQEPSVILGPWSENIIVGPMASEVVFDLALPVDDVNVIATADSILGPVPVDVRVVSVDALAGKSYRYAPMDGDDAVVRMSAEQASLAPAWQAIVTVPPAGPEVLGEVQVQLRAAVNPEHRVTVHGPLGPGEMLTLRIDVAATGSAILTTYQHALYAHDDSSGATPNEDVIQKEFTFDWEEGQIAPRTEVPAETTPGMAPLVALAVVAVVAAIRRR